MKKVILLFLLLIPLATATTLQGTIYNEFLEIENDVLVEINTVPQQKFLAKSGEYTFDLPVGTYTITAKKEEIVLKEEIKIEEDGIYIYDLFLFPDFTEEDDLWQDTEEDLFADENGGSDRYALWRYFLGAAIVLFALWRFGKARKKYGSIRKFKKRIKAESRKSVEQHKKELANEPSYIDNALEIIRKHDGRITQKELRKEMLYLSEAKVSLIVTELEHKGKVEKVKKGRGNVIILKGESQ